MMGSHFLHFRILLRLFLSSAADLSGRTFGFKVRIPGGSTNCMRQSAGRP